MIKPKILTIIAIVAIIFLAATNVATAYLLISKGKLFSAPVKENVIPQTEKKPETVVETPAVSEETSTTPTVQENNSNINTEHVLNTVYTNGRPNFSVPAGMKNIIVTDWHYDPERDFKAKDFFTADFKTISSASLSSYNNLIDFKGQEDHNISYIWHIKSVGVISSSSDKYAGKDLYMLSWSCDDLGCSYVFSGLAVVDKEAGRLYLLTRYSSPQSNLKKALGINIFTEDASAYIAEMENPEVVNLPGTDYKLTKKYSSYLPIINEEVNMVDFYAKNYNKYIADSTNGKKVYLNEADSCFLVYNENGSHSTYEFNYPIPVSAKASVLALTFNDGQKNKNDYIGLHVGGCGASGCGRLINVNEKEIVVVGKFGNGDTAYEYSYDKLIDLDKTHPIQNIYDSYYSYGKEKPNLETFMGDHPLVLWKTPIKGYYLGFLRADYIQAAECGKPVIYLYPTKKTDVKVQVTPNGGFSITDPLYGKDGWLVSADPQSNLLNYTDGKNYPYLFWEGKAVYYQRPAEGFVVARENVDSFLTDKLAKLGLIEKEINDFKEFWVPKFADKPYYFITFLPKSDFDKLAPMKVDPKPQTVIRVFMDYEGLDAPVKVVEQKIVTPKRVGFTVVEWGGALNRK